jgi:hypothetical protein
MIMGWATRRPPSAGQATPQFDQSTDPVTPDPTELHTFSYRLGIGELREQLQAPTAPVRIQPLQLDTHGAEGAAFTLRSQGQALIAASSATKSHETPQRALFGRHPDPERDHMITRAASRW